MILPSFEYLDGPTKLTFFLLDLTRVKSNRACLPLGRRVPRQPRQARADFQRSAPVESPLPAGLRPSAIGPGKRPPDVCFRVLRPTPYRKCLDSFSPWP